jgi:hypothetical protein
VEQPLHFPHLLHKFITPIVPLFLHQQQQTELIELFIHLQLQEFVIGVFLLEFLMQTLLPLVAVVVAVPEDFQVLETVVVVAVVVVAHKL